MRLAVRRSPGCCANNRSEVNARLSMVASVATVSRLACRPEHARLQWGTVDPPTPSGCSAVGSAPRSGRGGPGFKSRHPDHSFSRFGPTPGRRSDLPGEESVLVLSAVQYPVDKAGRPISLGVFQVQSAVRAIKVAEPDSSRAVWTGPDLREGGNHQRDIPFTCQRRPRVGPDGVIGRGAGVPDRRAIL